MRRSPLNVSRRSVRDGGVEIAHRGGWSTFVRPDTAADGQKIGPRPHQAAAIVHGNAADGDAGDFHQLLPPGQKLGFGLCLGLLGRGVEEGTEGDVVGPGLGRDMARWREL